MQIKGFPSAEMSDIEAIACCACNYRGIGDEMFRIVDPAMEMKIFSTGVFRLPLTDDNQQVLAGFLRVFSGIGKTRQIM